MSDFPTIEIEELNKRIISQNSYLNDLSIADIDGSRTDFELAGADSPVRMNALIILLILEGSCELNIDYVSYDLTPDTFVTIMPTHIIQFGKVSPDLKGRVLIVSRSFMEQAAPAKRSPNIHYMHIRKNPCAQLSSDDIRFLDDCLLSIREKIRLRKHLLQRELLQNALLGFFIEVANIMMAKGEFVTPPTLSRKEELLDQFLQLLFKHCKEEHVVTFYADKLFITPQYLSLVLKELTGKSANKWIDESLIVEAKILLKSPQNTVQKVADMLHFSDQSTFGKFFKKHVGQSPSEFRKS